MQTLDPLIDRQIGSLVATYKSLHRFPELSGHEEKTSALVANELRTAGYSVTERVGKYKHAGLVGYGVVGVMKNGSGPTVLIRTELDALPVTEKAGFLTPAKSRRETIPAKMAVSKRTGEPLPSLHSSLFAPLPEPTIRTGVKAMTCAGLDLMKK